MKRAIVTVETRRLSVIRSLSEAIELWCQHCGRNVPTVTPETAARLSGATVRAVYRQIETGSLHFLETTDGLLFVCTDSLALQKESEQK